MALKEVEVGGKVEARVRRYCWQSWRSLDMSRTRVRKQDWTYTTVEVTDEYY